VKATLSRLLRLEVLALAALLALAGVVATVSKMRAASEAPVIVERLETLRAAFNAQPDHVRAILLASPT